MPSAALAFSQIGSGDGSATQKEGIIAVPLPPLGEGAATVPRPGQPAATTGTPATTGANPPASSSPPSGAKAPATAPSAATPPATTSKGSGAAPATGPDGSSAADGPAGATPVPPAGPDAVPSDPGSTDEGEVELPIEPDDAVSDPADADDGSEPLVTPPAAGSGTGAADPAGAQDASPGDEAERMPPAQVYYAEDGLPKPVRDLRAKLIEIARSGDIEALRPYLETGEEGTVLTFGGSEEDPIAYLKSASGDGEGVEILAILLEVLQAGHVRNEPDTDNEIFVWPYFTGVPVDKLTKPQKVELFELVTAGDYQEMLGFGAYNFYRAGISPDGRLQFFVAGD